MLLVLVCLLAFVLVFVAFIIQESCTPLADPDDDQLLYKHGTCLPCAYNANNEPCFVGATGQPGATGPQLAPYHVTGNVGHIGVQGSPGATGATGATGMDGIQGASGTAGDVGDTGPVGAQGPQGPIGATGETGPDSLPGAPGPAGATGPAGQPGLVGPSGLAGVVGMTGPTGLAAAIGETGPAGEVGATGVAGFVGIEGPTGVQGPTGATTIGSTGATGATGTVVGLQGPQGPTGAGGDVGETGPLASDGQQGPAGPTGVDGEQGVAGQVGITGPVGPTGEVGATGATGPTGAVNVAYLNRSRYTLQTLNVNTDTVVALNAATINAGGQQGIAWNNALYYATVDEAGEYLISTQLYINSPNATSYRSCWVQIYNTLSTDTVYVCQSTESELIQWSECAAAVVTLTPNDQVTLFARIDDVSSTMSGDIINRACTMSIIRV